MYNVAYSSQVTFTVTSGRSYPLGSTPDPDGVNFAIFSANAHKVQLCLFDESGEEEIARISLPEFTDDVWHGHVEGLSAGTLYGYRVYGEYQPSKGHRFNHHKLLVDPYAKKFTGEFQYVDQNYGYEKCMLKNNASDITAGHHASEDDLVIDTRDNAQFMPKCVVTAPLLASNSHPQVRRRDTVIYEMHVKGFTQLQNNVPEKLRGTFAGLAHQSNIDYLQSLGVTSIELLPIHAFVSEPFVEQKSLSNYWGYNSIGFFAPHAHYQHADDIAEFKQLVETFHKAGIEVVLDVVYNHTAEGNQWGPTFSFKGIDNASYYRLIINDARYYENFSGCGNTLNVDHPRVIQMVLDSLRYWVEIMGVDGFRFDLAPIMGRGAAGFTRHHKFFSALQQDPILAKVKLIAEPWDIGEGGYQLGQFPKSWLEWNDRFRDTSRRFWRGDNNMVAEFAKRLHGSADLFESPSRRPSASINFITSHDGFSLHDLVSYEQVHNHQNGEENRDGHKSNFSANFGVEGECENSTINKLRARQKRNLLTTLFISQGTPMLLAGDELGNSQQGNNNAYCQDNEISWIDWQGSDAQQQIEFVKALIQLRKNHPLLNRTHYQHGEKRSNKTGLADISWLNCKGQSMQEHDWHDGALKCFAMLLAKTDEPDSNNDAKAEDDALMIIFNAHPCEIHYQLPTLNGYWQLLLDTADKHEEFSKNKTINNMSDSSIVVEAHSCIVLTFVQANQSEEQVA